MRMRIYHSSSELYGSDRSLLSIVREALDRKAEVTVVLPADGPLRARLRELGASVVLRDSPILRRQEVATTRGALRLLRQVWAWAVRPASSSGLPDWTLNNTSVCLGGVVDRLRGRRRA